MSYRVVVKPRVKETAKRLGLYALWLGGAGLLCGAAFVFSFFTAMRVEMQSSEVTVPDVAGMTLDAARRLADPLELPLEVVDRRNDARVPSGSVLEQMPPAGASVRRGRKMKLILSLGGKVLTVPDLAGDAARAVLIRLRQDGFTPGEQARAYSYDAGVGRVLAQVPPAETTVVPNSRVHCLVSDGPLPATWVMPQLIGHPREAAERWIVDGDFRRGAVRRVRASGREPGTVVAQLPEAGYPIRSKDIVELAVAE